MPALSPVADRPRKSRAAARPVPPERAAAPLGVGDGSALHEVRSEPIAALAPDLGEEVAGEHLEPGSLVPVERAHGHGGIVAGEQLDEQRSQPGRRRVRCGGRGRSLTARAHEEHQQDGGDPDDVCRPHGDDDGRSQPLTAITGSRGTSQDVVHPSEELPAG